MIVIMRSAIFLILRFLLNLHSFPTRRSSDLATVAAIWGELLPGAYGAGTAGKLLGDKLGSVGVTLADAVTRSEEHTSELQSLRHLVCRPLLEKTKTTLEISFEVAPIVEEPYS